MILYVVRHGFPDYNTDSLTDEGRREAEAVAHRLSSCGITKIFSSPLGRAIETAQPLSEMLGIPTVIEEWARELGPESKTVFPDGKPKSLVLVPNKYYNGTDNARLSTDDALSGKEPFKSCDIAAKYKEIADGIDGLLARLGYRRTEEGLYTAERPNSDRAVLFCHRGMTGVVVSHLLNIPFQFLAGAIYGTFTGVTAFSLPSVPSDDCAPVMLSFGDAGHLNGTDLPRKNGITGENF